MKEFYTAGELAKLTKVSYKTIRHYRDKGIIEELFRICRELLTENGMFVASTVGQTHFKELFKLISGFDKSIEIPDWISENFELENILMRNMDRFSTDIMVSEYKKLWSSMLEDK